MVVLAEGATEVGHFVFGLVIDEGFNLFIGLAFATCNLVIVTGVGIRSRMGI